MKSLENPQTAFRADQSENPRNDETVETQAATTDGEDATHGSGHVDSAPVIDGREDEIEMTDAISSKSQSFVVAGEAAVADDTAAAGASNNHMPADHGGPHEQHNRSVEHEKEAVPASKTIDVLRKSKKVPLADTARAAIQQANGIDRNPDNSIIDYVKAKEFHQAWLDRLYARWDDGKEAYFISFLGRCEIVYLIHKETVKPGCTGGFSAALRRLELAASTAYDMIQRHKILIGEMEDPDAPDSRDDEEEQEEQKEGEGGSEETKPKVGGATKKSRRAARPRQHGASPKVTLTLSDPIRKAVDAVKIHFHQANAKAVIQFCVLRVAREIDTPIASRGDDAIANSRSRRSPLILPDNDDPLPGTTANSEAKSVISEYPSHPPSPQEVEGVSGAA